MADVIEHRGRWTVEDRFASPWHYLPVEVGQGACALRVELSYDRTGGAVLDLGCVAPGGFRGWSGGARESFVITPEAATPGYLAGELEPGEWQVIIGVHRVPRDGAEYRLTARVTGLADDQPAPLPDPPPPPAERPPPRNLQAGPGQRWLAGDLHTHTVHSDGALTVSELAAYAARSGLDYLAITDHNTISHHGELASAADRYGVILLPGQEVTTESGHANVLGDVGWVDFRLEPDEWLAAARRGGGLMSINHPIAGPVSWLRHMRERPPLVEVWHWSWLDPRWTTPLAWWQAWDPAAVPVGGSDWHRPGSDAPVGRPTTWARSAAARSGAARSGAARSGAAEPDDILDAIGHGAVAISADRDGPVLLREDGELVAVDADGLILAGPDGPYARVRADLARFTGTAGFHRLLTPDGATLALTP